MKYRGKNVRVEETGARLVGHAKATGFMIDAERCRIKGREKKRSRSSVFRYLTSWKLLILVVDEGVAMSDAPRLKEIS
jgi:formate-dependent phosphoribosylglycinamide formyltransferase (GAR transformylase)